MSLIEAYIARQPDPEAAQSIYDRWWKDFVPVHKHGMLGTLSRHVPDVDPAQLNYGETGKPLVLDGYLLKKLFGRIPLTTDTDHAAHPLTTYEWMPGDERDMQLHLFHADHAEETIDEISRRVAIRAGIIRQHNSTHPDEPILTGVEVDILSPDGRLDVNDMTLATLEYNTASLHPGEWSAYYQIKDEKEFAKDLTGEQLCQLFASVADHPIHTISHPLRELPASLLQEIEQMIDTDSLHLHALCTHLVTKNVALEFNLSDAQDPKRREERRITLKLLARAKAYNVPLVLGTDFHMIYYKHMASVLPDDTIQEGLSEAVKERFYELYDSTKTQDRRSGDTFPDHQSAEAYTQAYKQLLDETFAYPAHAAAFIRPFCVISRILEREGFQPEDFVNTNQRRFLHWLQERKKTASLTV